MKKLTYIITLFLLPVLAWSQSISSVGDAVLHVEEGTIIATQDGIIMGGSANNVFTIPQGTTLHDGAPYSHSVLMTNPNSTYTVRDVQAGQIAHFYAAVSFASQAAQADMRLQNTNATSDYHLQLISTTHAGYMLFL